MVAGNADSANHQDCEVPVTVTYRAAHADEMERVYIMGYDAWGEGKLVEDYLDECRKSSKYRLGSWFVLNVRTALVASLIVYSFEDWGDSLVRGIGSVAADPSFRKMGYGHQIVRSATNRLIERDGVRVIFLYSDIGSSFYEDVGYLPLSTPYQKTSGSTLMARMHPALDESLMEKYRDRIPKYF